MVEPRPLRAQGKTMFPAEREIKMWEAFELSCRRHSIREIAKELGVSRDTASKLVKDAALAYRKENTQTKPQAIRTYEMIIRNAYDAAERLDPGSREKAPLLRAANDAQANLDKLLDHLPPTRTAVQGHMQHQVAHIDLTKHSVEKLQGYYEMLEELTPPEE